MVTRVRLYEVAALAARLFSSLTVGHLLCFRLLTSHISSPARPLIQLNRNSKCPHSPPQHLSEGRASSSGARIPQAVSPPLSSSGLSSSTGCLLSQIRTGPRADHEVSRGSEDGEPEKKEPFRRMSESQERSSMGPQRKPRRYY